MSESVSILVYAGGKVTTVFNYELFGILRAKENHVIFNFDFFRQIAIRRIRWFNLAVLTISPLIAIYGLVFLPYYDKRTQVFTAFYYLFTMLGITAGYHRLWSHRSYTASRPLQWFLILGGTSAVQGSCYWWAKSHRSHHRYTDTDLDPYNSKRGLLYTHVGWIIFTSNSHSGTTDVSDLKKNTLVQWQHRWYFPLAAILGYFLPVLVPAFCWGDWLGGLCLSGALRMTVAHHSVFCINSLAHYIGMASYDDKHSPRDHFISAFFTLGEGYHNFHHQFPMDYRNAFHWYQYDPTKWFIALCNLLRLASHLQVFPDNEIRKGALTMKLKKLREYQDNLQWPVTAKDLPVVTWDEFQQESKNCTLILISGFIHDVGPFVDHHPGGKAFLVNSSGKDMTASFFGGVYDHSHAALNLLAMKRIAVLHEGMEVIEDNLCHQLHVAKGLPTASSTSEVTTGR